MLMENMIVHSHCVFSIHENGVKQQFLPDFSSEVGSSAHHFLDIIKGSRMSLISLGDDDDDDDDDDASLITNNPKSWVI